MTEKEIKVWTNNLEAVEGSILAGEEHEPILTEYGANEFAVDFLWRSGLWEQLLVKPEQGKDNGKDWRQLSGIAILHELLHVGRLAKADKVIKDAKLMRELGFTLTEIESAKGQTTVLSILCGGRNGLGAKPMWLMGLAIGPINSDERELLLQIFKDLEKYVDKIKNIMDVIVLDRGYWGYDFLEKTLVGEYSIDYVVIAKKSFMFVKEDLRHLIDSQQLKFQERQLYNRTRKEWEAVKVAFVKDLFHGYVSKEQPYRGLVNVVAMKYMEGKEEKEVFYVTNRKVPKNPLKIVQLYGDRWTIENQGSYN